MIRRKNLRVVVPGIGISLLLLSGAARAQLSVTGSNLNLYFGIFSILLGGVFLWLARRA